jgi:hypothetical protein
MRGTPNSYTVESSLSDAFENRVIVHQNTVEAFIESLPRALRRR